MGAGQCCKLLILGEAQLTLFLKAKINGGNGNGVSTISQKMRNYSKVRWLPEMALSVGDKMRFSITVPPRPHDSGHHITNQDKRDFLPDLNLKLEDFLP